MLLFHKALINNKSKGKPTFAFCYFIKKKSIDSVSRTIFLNLPTEVLWGNGDKISYAYDASGAKLAKYVLKNMLSSSESTYYMNGFQYSQEAGKGSQPVLQFFPTAEGYVNVTGGTTFNYVYNYTDHFDS
ncbi:hypothetical protein ACTS9C_04880 [Empedobacter brevis]